MNIKILLLCYTAPFNACIRNIANCRMTEGLCGYGNKGFPIVVNGIYNVETRNQPNDLQTQFGPAVQLGFDTQTGIFNVPGTHSFFLGGTQYALSVLKLCRHSRTGAETGPTPSAELQFWGRSRTELGKTDSAVLVIPIISADTSSQEGLKLLSVLNNQSVSLTDLIPGNKEILRYTTCIDLIGSRRTSLAVAAWRKGISIDANNISTIVNAVRNVPFGIPLDITYNAPAISSQGTQTTSVTNNSALTYSTTLNAESADYNARFTMMVYKPPALAQSKDYKCVTIDRARDIIDNKLVIDPTTGKRLDEEIQQELEDKAELDKVEPPTVTGGDIETYTSVIVGILVGSVIIGLAVVVLKYYFTRPLAADVAAAALTAATSVKIEWRDLLVPGFLVIAFMFITTIIAIATLTTSRHKSTV